MSTTPRQRRQGLPPPGAEPQPVTASLPTFRIVGRVIERTTKQGIAGLRVEAWDKDETYKTYNSLVGVEWTAVDGSFTIAFDQSYFGDSSGDLNPDLYYRVFQGSRLVRTTEDAVQWNVPAGEVAAVIDVDGATLQPAPPPPPPASTEVALHELGEILATTATDVQQQVASYPSTLGTYVLDEVELSIPVQVRVDALGQFRATVIPRDEPVATENLAQLRLRLRASADTSAPRPVIPSQKLAALGLLSPDAIARLEAERVFSVADLQRVARNAAGLTSLNKLGLNTDVNGLLARAAVLSLPMLPAPVAECLLKVGIVSPSAFLGADPATLAATLSSGIGEHVDIQDVLAWQQDAHLVVDLPLPSRLSPTVTTATRAPAVQAQAGPIDGQNGPTTPVL